MNGGLGRRWGGAGALAACLVVFMVGCTIEAGSQSGSSAGSADPGVTSPSAGSIAAPDSTGAGGSAAGQPLIVRVDADRTLSAVPGDGVGVFTEYRTGGHWHVWWTCDTNVTHHDCGYRVAVTPVAGSLANAVGADLSPLDTFLQSSDRLDIVTETSVGTQGVTFDAEPGASIQIDAQVNQARNGAFFFFVQGGIVNGGYTGPLSDPLVFQP